MEKKMLYASGLVATVVVGVFAMVHSQTSPVSAQFTTATVPFMRLARGEHSDISDRVNFVIKSPDELTALWKAMGATSTPPSVDFKTQTVLAVFAGTSGGTSVAVTRIEDVKETRERVVSIVVAKPQGQCEANQTSEYELVAVAATSLPINHHDIIATTSCSH